MASQPSTTHPCETWASAWSQTSPSVWTSIYTPTATYTDYAFGFIRRGHGGLKQHFDLWRTAHPDFQIIVLETWPAIDLGNGRTKHSIRTKNVGTFTNDLPSMKASGRKFEFYAAVDLVMREEDGLIEEVEEWYHRQFDSEALVERDLDGSR
ncbi:uncharacterized protein LTR77_000904 [Saxophila tyrrhenica]|uniref:SnoaL-like domain-containing protein n=1 Tax=Saxophila tyrrhenica TaxID=1690608 RepID=A0AAV9PRW1_9PEZI|nr:hypothetical protein LTR77_000904 [Saxophila tyrrhenica]